MSRFTDIDSDTSSRRPSQRLFTAGKTFMKVAIVFFASINIVLMLVLLKTAARATTNGPLKALIPLAFLTFGGLGLFFANVNSALNWMGLVLVGAPAVLAGTGFGVVALIAFIAWITGARWN
jgi:hypothetical protein